MNDFHTYIKAVGIGKKHNRDLNIDETCDAVKMMLDKQAHPEQVAAFLLGWRIKPETNDEFLGMLRAFDTFVQTTEIKNSIELGYPYDGKVKNPYLFPLIAKELQPFGLNLIVSGDHLQPAKGGLTTKDICTNMSLESNIHFFDRADYFPQLSALTEVRNRLGLRTALNSAERLLNPAQSKHAIIGAFHKPFVDKYIKMYEGHYKRLAVLKAVEGAPEILGKCTCWISDEKGVSEIAIDPGYYGINYEKSWDAITLEESIELTMNPSKELLGLVKLNAALHLYLFEKANSIEEGYEMLK